MTKIGIIKEGKIPIDRRVPVTPSQAKHIAQNFDVEIAVQSSDIRCFRDEDYISEGVDVVGDISDCDIILGVKEVPISSLADGKTHFFFSHTIKKQDYNQPLIRAILDKDVRLVDWETLTDQTGNRIIAFGRWAGIVGAYNGLWTYGKKYDLYDIRRANECFDHADLKTEFPKIQLPPIKIAITGGGRVAMGAVEVLEGAGIKQVTPESYLEDEHTEAVFTVLNSQDYNKRKDGEEFVRARFHSHPAEFEGDFLKYGSTTDILIACAFWDPSAPVLFSRDDVLANRVKLSVVADVTCDIEGSIPSTKQPSTIDDPIYDYNATEDAVNDALSQESHITVMAVDNLPCELPRDASENFGAQLIENVLPHLLGNDDLDVIKNATITENGQLTDRYAYLQDYADGK